MKEIVEHAERDEFDDSEYTDEHIRATVMHHKDNDGENNRHAILLDDDVIVLETKE